MFNNHLSILEEDVQKSDEEIRVTAAGSVSARVSVLFGGWVRMLVDLGVFSDFSGDLAYFRGIFYSNMFMFLVSQKQIQLYIIDVGHLKFIFKEWCLMIYGWESLGRLS